MIYAVIDTNVIVSSLLSQHLDAATVLIRKYILNGKIVPLFNEEIYHEYVEVLHREKLHLPTDAVDAILDAISFLGMMLERTKTEEIIIDQKDVVFYEVALSKEGSYLVTGNTKHFPKTPIVVTPAELLSIIEAEETH
ncbi:MAG: putative toxin-antitoxin system toxin component, PIN family [Bacteroidales bacterium]|nr:putative toxin-antitoxin system toxin component, PIN family [Bacteroidales bacterium]